MPPFQALAVLIIFVVTYGAFMRQPAWRGYLAIAGALLVVLFGGLSPVEAFWQVKWVVMGIFFGVLILAHLFQWSKAPDFIAEHIVNMAHDARWALLLICLITSFLSIFIENVAAVLIVAPVAFAICQRLDTSPVPVIIGIAVSSNLQGAATLIGDPPSMLLAGYAGLNFNDFFIYQGRPSMFFATQVGAVTSLVVLWWVFRHDRGEIEPTREEPVRSWTPSLMLGLLILALATASFMSADEPPPPVSAEALEAAAGDGEAARIDAPSHEELEPIQTAEKKHASDLHPVNGWICVGFAAFGFLWFRLLKKQRLMPLIRELDWQSGFFLVGCFIIVGSLEKQGWIAYVSRGIQAVGGENPFLVFTIFVWFSVLVSAFIDNVPYLIAMLPVAGELAEAYHVSPALFFFGLLIGASLGGNITPIGASANVVAFGILRKEGYQVRMMDFVKIGLPFTVAAVGAGYLFIWFFWSGA